MGLGNTMNCFNSSVNPNLYPYSSLLLVTVLSCMVDCPSIVFRSQCIALTFMREICSTNSISFTNDLFYPSIVVNLTAWF